MHSNANIPTQANNRRRRARSRYACRSARGRGAVILMMLFGAFMIVGMLAYIFNTGRHAQLRQQTQHAADATAISGGGYIARSFNTVAMNNVEMSRLIAVVQMLDAVPLATEYTLLDVQATLECVKRQQANGGTGDPLGDQTLAAIAQDLYEQEYKLTEMDRFFNHSGYDVREMTFYDSEFGRGELWKAMESLDAISSATMEHLRELTYLTAYEDGLRNLPYDLSRSMAAFVMPVDGVAVWKRYEFDDFRDPVTRGRLPDWVDDEVTNRGPYDTIFGWRAEQREAIEIPNPDYNPSRTTNRAGSRWSGGTGRGGRRNIQIGSELLSYTTYGTWQWLADVLRRRVDTENVLYNSQFTTRVNRMAGNKLNYLWAGSAREWPFLEPEWITDFAQAQAIIEARTPRVAYTQFIRMDYRQQFINDVPVGPESMTDWQILRPRGGWTSVPGATKTGDHRWEDQATIEWEVTRVIDDEGTTTTDEYRTEYRWIFVWAGINVGPQITIRDPNNFSSRADLPAPIDFDHTVMPRPYEGSLDVPYSPFTYLAVVKQPNDAMAWDGLFDTSAFDGHVAIAQVSVFNNHSWDLWTQMWHAQLEPVGFYDYYVDNMVATDQEVLDVIEYLRTLKTLAPEMLQH